MDMFFFQIVLCVGNIQKNDSTLIKNALMNTMYISSVCIIMCTYMDISWRGGGLQNTKYKPSLGVGIAMHPTKNTKKRRYISITCHFSLRLHLRMIRISHMTVSVTLYLNGSNQHPRLSHWVMM